MKSRLERAGTALIVVMLGLTLFAAIPMTVPKQAAATTVTIGAGPWTDGQISLLMWNVTGTGGGTLMRAQNDTGYGNADSGYYHNWHNNGTFSYHLYRYFFNFDTTTIPVNAIVTSATIKMWLGWYNILDEGVGRPTDTTSDIYTSNFTDDNGHCDVGDWNKIGSYQGTMWTLFSPDQQWHSLTVNASSVVPGAQTQYMNKASFEGAPGQNLTWNQTWWAFGSVAYPVYPGTHPIQTLRHQLVITYQMPGAEYSIGMSGGGYLNGTAYAEITEWNVTHDLYYFAIDVPTNATNLTIFKKAADWTLVGVAPSCPTFENNSLVLLNITYGGLCYRVWFTVAKLSPVTTLHIAMYNAFTGEGFFWENFKVMISNGAVWDDNTKQTVSQPDYKVALGNYYTVRVLDYFGNVLAETIVNANAAEIEVTIGVPVYSWQVFNMNDAAILVRIFWNNSVAPEEFFVGPHWIQERFLKGGDYTFWLTFYQPNGFAGDTVSYNQTIPLPGLNASFIYVNGTTITQIVTSITGLYALSEIITQLVSPSVLWLGRNLPQVPSYIMSVSNVAYVNTLYMVDARTLENGTGTSIDLASPIPVGVADSKIGTDILSFSGDYNTHVWVNATGGGAGSWSSSTLPPSIQLTGGTAYHVAANTSISVSRLVDFRWYRSFVYEYTPSNLFYSAVVTVENALVTDWTNVTLFIPFMNNTYVNNRSVQLWDMNNTAYLTEGIHWAQSKTGVHLWFANFSVNETRGFRLTYKAVNETNIGPVHIEVATVGDGTTVTMEWHKDTFYFCTARWVNDRREDYTGAIYVDLTFSLSVDPDTVKVFYTDTMTLVQGVTVAGKTIIIDSSDVKVGDDVSYTIIFKSKSDKTVLDVSFANIPIVTIAGFVALVSFLMGVFLLQFREGKRAEVWGRFFIGLAVLAMLIVVVVFIYFIGTTGGGA